MPPTGHPSCQEINCSPWSLAEQTLPSLIGRQALSVLISSEEVVRLHCFWRVHRGSSVYRRDCEQWEGVFAPNVSLWGRVGCKTTGKTWDKSSSFPSLYVLGKSPRHSGLQLPHAEFGDKFWLTRWLWGLTQIPVCRGAHCPAQATQQIFSYFLPSPPIPFVFFIALLLCFHILPLLNLEREWNCDRVQDEKGFSGLLV